MKQHLDIVSNPDQVATEHNTSDNNSSIAQHGLGTIPNEPADSRYRLADSQQDSDEEDHDDDLLSRTVVLPPSQAALTSVFNQKETLLVDASPHGTGSNISDERPHIVASQRSASTVSSSSDQEDVPATRSCIDMLPLETLTRILALLDPIHLVKASLVCRNWAGIARDDATWRRAFCNAFGLGDGAGIMRRTDASSWKAEYRNRIDLLRRWRKSRSPAISSDMRVGNIHSLALSSKHSFLLSASSSYGVASRSDPFRGKVARGFLDADGILNGGGIGNPNTEFSPDVSCLAISNDANKIVWGFKNGSISITSLGRQGSNPHGLVRNIRFSPRGSHLGQVNAIAFDRSVRGQKKRPQSRRVSLGPAAECFVTGGADGTVRLWSPERALPIWIGSTATEGQVAPLGGEEPPGRASASIPHPVTKLEFDADCGMIVAGTASGQVYLWMHIDVSSILALSGRAWTDEEGQEPQITTSKQDAAKRSFQEELKKVTKVLMPADEAQYSRQQEGEEGKGQIAYLCLIAISHSETRLLSHREGDPTLWYHLVRDTVGGTMIDTKLLLMSRTLDGSQIGGQGYITCVRAALDVAGNDLGSGSSHGTPAVSPLLHPTLDDAQRGSSPRATFSPQPRPLLLGSSATARNLSSGPFAEKEFVCAGTSSGCLVGWVLPSFNDLDCPDLLPNLASRQPALSQTFQSFVLDCHHAAVTSLDLAPHLFVVGTIDGQLKAFDSLTGEPLRTWTDRMATKHLARQLLDSPPVQGASLSAEERERFKVKQILVDEEWLLAAIGPWVLAWRPETALSGHQRRHSPRVSSPHSSNTPPVGRRANGMSALSKYARMKELKTELAESSLILEREKASRQASYERLRFARGSDEVGGLSEEEALEYAIILSRQEAESQGQKAERAESGTEGVQLSELARIRREEKELQDALEQIALAEAEDSRESKSSRGISPGSSASERDDLSPEDEEDYEEGEGEEYGVRSRYLSPSPRASPLLLPHSPGSSNSRAWDILRTSRSLSGSGAVSPLSTSANRSRWGEHTKVQTVRVPRESWSPQSLPVDQGRTASASAGGHGGQEEDWPSLNSGSYSSSHHSLSVSPLRLGQEVEFKLEAVSDKLDEEEANVKRDSTKGKEKERENAASTSPFPSLVPSLPPLPTSPTPQQASSLYPASSPLIDTLPQPRTTPKVQGAWAKGSSALRATTPISSPPPSFAYRITARSGSRAEDGMDDDLRFAIELSLAEERSRCRK